ncbi:hypothetical protein [Streptobacillus canis]|uniref:hypothetical protein n=1 Tax=Streptobacillus canis TaxID=2678686 RepID=UPI0018CC5EA5|nr:hypothetical protein [Streptobacillus canis]
MILLKNYSKNELLLKNNYELNQIAQKEKIQNKYFFETSRNKIINRILEYTEFKYIPQIEEYLDEGYYLLQEFFENNLRVLELERYDIIIDEDFKIYKEIVSKIIIYVNKNRKIDLNIVFLVNEYRYIYGILQSEILEEDGEYVKCELTLHPELNRIINEHNTEKLYFAFFEQSVDLYSVYYNKYKSDMIKNSVFSYIVPIIKYEIIFNCPQENNLYIKIGIDYFETEYLKEDFCIDVINLENNISLNFGDDAKKRLKENGFITNRSYFMNVEYFLTKNEDIVIKDERQNSKIVSKNFLFEKFLEYYLRKIEYTLKTKFQSIIILKNEGYNQNDGLSFECLHNIKYFNNNDREYTYILSDLDIFRIIYVRHGVVNNKVSYRLNMLLQIIHENKYLTELSFLNHVMKYVSENKSMINYKGNIFNYLKLNKDLEIKNNVEPSQIIREKSKELINNYFSDITFEERSDLDDILTYLSFKSIFEFFDQFKIIDILKKFENIKLQGRLVYTKSFIDVLKEFIPGKLLEYKSQINNSEIFKIINDFNKKKEKGNLVLNYKFTPLKFDISISYLNYLGEIHKIISLYENKTTFIDKDNTTKFVELYVEKIFQFKKNELYNIHLYLPNEYMELDENELLHTDELGIKDFEIDEVVNDIVRIFFSFKDVDTLKVCYVRRREDQIFCQFEDVFISKN